MRPCLSRRKWSDASIPSKQEDATSPSRTLVASLAATRARCPRPRTPVALDAAPSHRPTAPRHTPVESLLSPPHALGTSTQTTEVAQGPNNVLDWGLLRRPGSAVRRSIVVTSTPSSGPGFQAGDAVTVRTSGQRGGRASSLQPLAQPSRRRGTLARVRYADQHILEE